MSTITIPKTEYKALKERAEAYSRIISAAEVDLFASPPTRSKKEVMNALRGTHRYSKAFLTSVGRGLSRLSYFKK
jgi:hypothetical protein